MSFHDRPWVVFLRWTKEGEIIKVKRTGSMWIQRLSLYPSSDPEIFYTEESRGDDSPRETIKRDNLSEILIRLLEGDSREAIFSDYEPHGNYRYFSKRGVPTSAAAYDFDITDLEER